MSVTATKLQPRNSHILLLLVMTFLSASLRGVAQTNLSTSTTSQTNRMNDPAAVREQRAAEIRAACINARRCICGKVIKIVPEGLVVESGYTALMQPPFTGAWV